jgi:hypothetical protein
LERRKRKAIPPVLVRVLDKFVGSEEGKASGSALIYRQGQSDAIAESARVEATGIPAKLEIKFLPVAPYTEGGRDADACALSIDRM